MSEAETVDILWVLRPLRGGMRTHVQRILQKLDHRRARVTVAAPVARRAVVGEAHPPALGRWRPLPRDYPASPTRFLRAAGRLRPLCAGADLIHVHGLWAGLLLRAAELGLPGPATPMLLTLHTLVQSPGQCAALLLLAARDNLRICAVSRAVRDSARGAGAPVHVIPNGIDQGRVVRIPGSGPVRLLYVGRLERRKGLDVLLAGLRRLRGGRWTLRVVGDGPLRGKYRRAARRMGLARHIEWCGWRTDVTPYYRTSDLLIAPSRSEAAGLALAEAMTFGVPPVAARTGGISELVQHGRSGWLVPTGDPDALAGALSHLLEDENMRRRLGRGARRRSRELPGWEDVAGALETLYRDITAAAGERRR